MCVRVRVCACVCACECVRVAAWRSHGSLKRLLFHPRWATGSRGVGSRRGSCSLMTRPEVTIVIRLARPPNAISRRAAKTPFKCPAQLRLPSTVLHQGWRYGTPTPNPVCLPCLPCMPKRASDTLEVTRGSVTVSQSDDRLTRPTSVISQSVSQSALNGIIY